MRLPQPVHTSFARRLQTQLPVRVGMTIIRAKSATSAPGRPNKSVHTPCNWNGRTKPTPAYKHCGTRDYDQGYPKRSGFVVHSESSEFFGIFSMRLINRAPRTTRRNRHRKDP